ncbi:MAG: hypothetical protein M9883_03920 [Methylobacteriaceae bacterium]|nr:hypothetical protein [Methylobacteriaceae bacterium]
MAWVARNIQASNALEATSIRKMTPAAHKACSPERPSVRRIDDEAGRQHGVGLVVVDHDGVEADLTGMGKLGVGRGAAVDRNQERGLLVREMADRAKEIYPRTSGPGCRTRCRARAGERQVARDERGGGVPSTS